MPDDAQLPQQPDEIAASVAEVTVTQELKADIKAASPHCRLIKQRRVEKIREGYSEDDELYLARIGTGAALGIYTPSEDEMQELTVYKEYVEAIREWARGQYEGLGLG